MSTSIILFNILSKIITVFTSDVVADFTLLASYPDGDKVITHFFEKNHIADTFSEKITFQNLSSRSLVQKQSATNTWEILQYFSIDIFERDRSEFFEIFLKSFGYDDIHLTASAKRSNFLSIFGWENMTSNCSAEIFFLDFTGLLRGISGDARMLQYIAISASKIRFFVSGNFVAWDRGGRVREFI